MAKTQDFVLSSAFDEMLSRNRQRLDQLYRRPQPGKTGDAAEPVTPTATRPAALPPGFDPALSVAARQLTERFGADWRFEILSRQRDGDEAIVLGKLTLAKDGTTRMQFGRAKIPGGPVSGSSAGHRFALSGAAITADEERGFRRATEAALKNCADQL